MIICLDITWLSLQRRGEGEDRCSVDLEPRVVRAVGRESICLAFLRLHEPEQVSCVVGVVSILLNAADASQ